MVKKARSLINLDGLSSQVNSIATAQAELKSSGKMGRPTVRKNPVRMHIVLNGETHDRLTEAAAERAAGNKTAMIEMILKEYFKID